MIRITPATPRNTPSLLWDTTWNGYQGDYAPAKGDEPANLGGLRAKSPLETAIILSLMTDRRALPSDRLPGEDEDRRGWPGDGIDPSRPPLGSRLWLLRRSELTDETARRAEDYSREALQPLIDQGAIARIEVTATPLKRQGQLNIEIKAFARNDDGRLVEKRFQILWEMSNGVSNPLAP